MRLVILFLAAAVAPLRTTSASTATPTLTLTKSESLSLSESLSVTTSFTSSLSATSTLSVTASHSLTSSLSSTMTLSRSVTPTATRTLSQTLSSSLSATISLSATDTLSQTLSSSLSATISLSATDTLSQTLSSSISATLSGTDTLSPTSSATLSLSRSSTATLSASMTATLSMTESATTSRTPTLSATPTVSLTPTFTITSTHSQTRTMSPTISVFVTPTATATQTMTATRTASTSATLSLTTTPTFTVSRSQTETLSPTVSLTPTFTMSSTPTASPSTTFTPSLSASMTSTFTLTPSTSFTLSPSASVTTTVTVSLTPTDTSSSTFTLTPSATVSLTPTYTLSSTFTLTPSATVSLTPTSVTPTFTLTSTFTVTASQTETLSPTVSLTPTYTLSSTFTLTPSTTFTLSLTTSLTPTFTFTPTATLSQTPTSTLSSTPTISLTPTDSITPTFTLTQTPTISLTPTDSITPTATLTQSSTITRTQTTTLTLTATATLPTPTATLTPTHTLPTPTDTLTKTMTLPTPTTTFTLPTPTPTGTLTLETPTLTITKTSTPPTPTSTASPTRTLPTPTLTSTATATPPTSTPTSTVTLPTPTVTPTATATLPSRSVTPSATATLVTPTVSLTYHSPTVSSPTATILASRTATVTATPTASRTETLPTPTKTATRTATPPTPTASGTATLTRTLSVTPTDTRTSTATLPSATSTVSRSPTLPTLTATRTRHTVTPQVPADPPLPPAALVVTDPGIRVRVGTAKLNQLNQERCQKTPLACGCIPSPCYGPDRGPNGGFLEKLAETLQIDPNRIKVELATGRGSESSRDIADRLSESAGAPRITNAGVVSATVVSPYGASVFLGGLSNLNTNQLEELAAAQREDLATAYRVSVDRVDVMVRKETSGYTLIHAIDTSGLAGSEIRERYARSLTTRALSFPKLEQAVHKIKESSTALVFMQTQSILPTAATPAGSLYLSGLGRLSAGEISRLTTVLIRDVARAHGVAETAITGARILQHSSSTSSFDYTLAASSQAQLNAAVAKFQAAISGDFLTETKREWSAISSVRVKFDVSTPALVQACRSGGSADCAPSTAPLPQGVIGKVPLAGVNFAGLSSGQKDSLVESLKIDLAVLYRVPPARITGQLQLDGGRVVFVHHVNPVNAETTHAAALNAFENKTLAFPQATQTYNGFGAGATTIAPEYTASYPPRVIPEAEVVVDVDAQPFDPNTFRQELAKALFLEDCGVDPIEDMLPYRDIPSQTGLRKIAVTPKPCQRSIPGEESEVLVTFTDDPYGAQPAKELKATLVKAFACCETTCRSSTACTTLDARGVNLAAATCESLDHTDLCAAKGECDWDGLSCRPAPDDDDFPLALVLGLVGGLLLCLLLLLLLFFMMKRRKAAGARRKPSDLEDSWIPHNEPVESHELQPSTPSMQADKVTLDSPPPANLTDRSPSPLPPLPLRPGEFNLPRETLWLDAPSSSARGTPASPPIFPMSSSPYPQMRPIPPNEAGDTPSFDFLPPPPRRPPAIIRPKASSGEASRSPPRSALPPGATVVPRMGGVSLDDINV